MANKDIVNGFIPVKHLNGSPWNGKTNVYGIPAADTTDTFVGDLVKLYGTSDANGVNQVIQAAATDRPVGVIVSFVPNPDHPQPYRVGRTLRYANVCDDPLVIFEAQEDSDAAALALADVGQNVDAIVGAGDTNTGKSGMELDSSTHATTNTLILRLLKAVQREGNVPVSSDNCKWEVLINIHEYNQTAGT